MVSTLVQKKQTQKKKKKQISQWSVRRVDLRRHLKSNRHFSVFDAINNSQHAKHIAQSGAVLAGFGTKRDRTSVAKPMGTSRKSPLLLSP